MSKERVAIGYLADHPELAPVCAAWAFGQWGCQIKGRTLRASIENFVKGAQKDALPLVLVAFNGAAPAGHIALCVSDCDERPDLTPWMASVYVHPFHRGKGIASLLIRRLEGEARRLDIRELYLITEDAQRLYARHGWAEIDRVASRFGGLSSLMYKSLNL